MFDSPPPDWSHFFGIVHKMLTDEISRPVLEKKGSMFSNRSRSPNLDALQMLYFINLRMVTEKSCPQNVHKRKSSQSAGEVGVA